MFPSGFPFCLIEKFTPSLKNRLWALTISCDVVTVTLISVCSTRQLIKFTYRDIPRCHGTKIFASLPLTRSLARPPAQFHELASLVYKVRHMLTFFCFFLPHGVSVLIASCDYILRENGNEFFEKVMTDVDADSMFKSILQPLTSFNKVMLKNKFITLLTITFITA